MLVKVSAIIKVFKSLPTLLQFSSGKLPIFDKSLATFSLEDVNGLKEIGECIAIQFQWMYRYYTWHSCSKESVIYGIPGFLICVMQGLFKRLLYKYYSKFVKAYKFRPNRLDIKGILH